MIFLVVGAVFMKLECCQRKVFELVIEFLGGRRNVLALLDDLEKVGAI